MGALSGLKKAIVKTLESLLKVSSGLIFLNKEDTIAYLKPHLISEGNESFITLPEVRNIVDNKLLIFPETRIQASRNFTWKYAPEKHEAETMRIGSIASDKKVLQTDFGYVNLLTGDYGAKYVIRDFITPDDRDTLTVDSLIAPWTHYFRKEYYMYLMFIAAKICRIKDAVPEKVFNEVFLSYPLFHTHFEKEYLELIGVDSGKTIDSRKTKIKFKECYLGNNDNWLHPNISDIMALKKHLEPKFQAKSSNEGLSNRIYISRSGRRRVLNESDLIELLKKFGFKVYEDKHRSVAEQYAIYNSASFIMGPHGSSFANVVWCKPGTHLFELFPPRYVYNFFHYLAVILGLEYSAYSDGPVSYEFNSQAINDDITVSIPDIEQYLTELFSENAGRSIPAL